MKEETSPNWSGFFLDLPEVILTTAHNLLNDNGQPHTDLIVNLPTQVLQLDGASQFSDV